MWLVHCSSVTAKCITLFSFAKWHQTVNANVLFPAEISWQRELTAAQHRPTEACANVIWLSSITFIFIFVLPGDIACVGYSHRFWLRLFVVKAQASNMQNATVWKVGRLIARSLPCAAHSCKPVWFLSLMGKDFVPVVIIIHWRDSELVTVWTEILISSPCGASLS